MLTLEFNMPEVYFPAKAALKICEYLDLILYFAINCSNRSLFSFLCLAARRLQATFVRFAINLWNHFNEHFFIIHVQKVTSLTVLICDWYCAASARLWHFTNASNQYYTPIKAVHTLAKMQGRISKLVVVAGFYKGSSSVPAEVSGIASLLISKDLTWNPSFSCNPGPPPSSQL